MTQALGQLRIDLTADWADFRTQMDRSADSLGKFGTKFGKVAGTVGTAALRMAGVVSGAFLSFAAVAVAGAEQAEGIRSAFRSSFGDAADAADEWATDTAAAMRLSQRDIRELATQFQNLFGEIAPTNEAAAEASMRFTELARDFAALKNISVEESVNKITAALGGSARGLRQYGIDLSESTVRAEALTRGIITQDQELSNEQATLVRASILMRELGDATGATADSTDDAEAATQRARAAYEDASDSLGTALLPAMTAVKNAFAGLLTQFNTFFSETVPNFITSNNEILARAVQLNEAFKGNFRSIEDVRRAVSAYRQGGQGAAAEAGEQATAIRGLSDETGAYSDTLANLATQVQNGGNRSGGRTRSWVEEHAAEIARLREQIDPLAVALERFAEQSAIAARAGLDVAAAQRAMALEAIEALGGVDAIRGALETLPPAFQEAAAEIAAGELADQIKEHKEALEEFALSLNAEFDGESAIRAEVNRITEAFEAGLIGIDVYLKAIREVTGEADAEREVAERLEEEAERRQREWQRLSDTIGDVAAGTRDAGEAAKQFVLEWLKAQWIQPFLDSLFKTGGGGSTGGGGGLFSGIGNFIGGLFGGGRADGGDVFKGMAYEVGERGRELFVPEQDGKIIPNGGYGGGVTMNIYTKDVGSFRASRRQLAREQRRMQGAE